ncbi:MAG: C1 family peptidase [Betaproteobacteria bacterium]|nr:C1 family peptidase [Betaproteobacteria bacterium]
MAHPKKQAASPSRRARGTESAPEATARKLDDRKLDAFPDRIDLRDWAYQPTLAPLTAQLVNCAHVPKILNQGSEGACTGFALAAVINFLLHWRGIDRRVSPRMLYELARRYDEWPGEAFEGSSARGGMKAWARHGVCTRARWPDDRHGPGHFGQDAVDEARLTPGGDYYRVDYRQVRDVHAALCETGIVYATLMVHEGWDAPGPTTVDVIDPDAPNRAGQVTLPVIQRKGRAASGHAVALVGYTAQGFIVQNSWGEGWGAGGFALLPYEDFMLHATDLWVAQLGVPVTADLWAGGAADTTSGAFRAGDAVPLADIRPFVIDVGNNGLLSDRGNYWTTEADLERLFLETIPARTAGWQKRRVMLYLHGGLNSERDVAKRIVAFRDVCLANEIYPLHVMWETDWFASARHVLEDQFTEADERAGGGFLEHLREARDRVLELTLAAPGGALWREMKENAELASIGPQGAMNLVVKYAKQAKAALMKEAKAEGSGPWELHVVAHSAGAILADHAIPQLASLGLAWKTLQFMAPAMRMDLFKDVVMPEIAARRCPRPSLYILDDEAERGDDVGPYGKSLLYLVSNAFEAEPGVPLLGMQIFLAADAKVSRLLTEDLDARKGVVVAGEAGEMGAVSRSETHGGFDNDVATMNSVLTRILGEVPGRVFVERDLQF